MAELVVVGFDDPQEADRVLTELARLQKEYLVDLEDAVVAIRGSDGRLQLKQSMDLVGAGAASGGLWGRCGARLSASSSSTRSSASSPGGHSARVQGPCPAA